MKKENYQIIFFDGICNLCNSAIQFIIKHDKKRFFRFASLQSELGQQFLKDRNMDPSQLDSILLVDPDVAYYTKSAAALRIAKHLSGLYPILFAFIIIPKFIRDKVYDYIAKNRYKWYGKKSECMIPTPEQQSLFLQ